MIGGNHHLGQKRGRKAQSTKTEREGWEKWRMRRRRRRRLREMMHICFPSFLFSQKTGLGWRTEGRERGTDGGSHFLKAEAEEEGAANCILTLLLPPPSRRRRCDTFRAKRAKEEKGEGGGEKG